MVTAKLLQSDVSLCAVEVRQPRTPVAVRRRCRCSLTALSIRQANRSRYGRYVQLVARMEPLPLHALMQRQALY